MPLSFRRALLTAALSIPLLTLRAAPAPDDSDSTVVARVGNTEITAGEIRAKIAALEPEAQAAAARDPATLDKVVRAILAQRLILKEALAAKWDQDPSVTAALQRLRDNAIIQTYLESISKPPETFPSGDQVQAAYDANKSRLQVPRQFDLAQIFIQNPKGSDASAAARAQVKLESVRKALSKRNADFAAIASAESDEPQSASKGGEIGWLTESRIQPEIRSQLGSLAKGSVSPPIRLDDGWHILKVLDVKQPYTPTLAEIRPQLIERMRAAQAQANSQQHIAKLLQDNPVQINEISLSNLLK